MKNFKLHSPNTPVKITGPGIQGRIEQVSIREQGIKYEIEYWVGNQITSVWLYESQFEVTEGENKKHVGFRQNAKTG